MAKKKNTLVFMDVSIDGDPAERMVFGLFYDIASKTAENFRALCTGERGVSPNTGKSLHYKGSFFHEILKGSIVRGGDFVNRNGTGGESIYGSKFPDESPRLKHDAPGLLSMAIADRETLGSHFIITLKADHHLDRKHVVFGKLVQGHHILKKIEDLGDEHGHPTVTVKIINCGEYNDDAKKMKKLKIGRDVSSEANSQEARRKVKHKKSSRDRRKRRKYYSSESESSSDSDMETTESDSDSDSDVYSSYTSSSSKGRRRKRKRSSRKGKHRRGKRRYKCRGKSRKKRDKRSKHRSGRESGSLTDSDSESKSDNSSDIGNQAKGKDQKDKDHSQKDAKVESPLNVENDLPPVHNKKQEELDMLEDEEFPKENGGCRSNGVGTNYRSDRNEERRPDVVDDHPGKSRSRSLSPKRSISQSMGISPRSERKSPSVGPQRRWSRSPIGNRSPRAPPRSLSRSPVRSINRSPNRSIRSPVRGRKGRSASRSPVRIHNRRSISKSPLRTRDHRSVSRTPVRTCDRGHDSKSPVRSLSRSHRSRSSPRPPSRIIVSRSPVRESRRSISRSPVRSSARSLSRSSGRVPGRSISRSPVRAPSRSHQCSYSRSRSPVLRARTPRGRSVSRSVSPDASPKRIKRGRGFSERYSYARRYRTPSRSPVRAYRYNGRIDRDRYSGYRRYSPRRYRSPLPRGRTPPRYRGRRSRTPSVSRSPRYRGRRYSHSRSPVRSRSPVEPYRSRASPHAERRMSLSRSRSQSRSRSSIESQSPRKGGRDNRSRSSSGSPEGKKGLVSYGDGSPDSSQR